MNIRFPYLRECFQQAIKPLLPFQPPDAEDETHRNVSVLRRYVVQARCKRIWDDRQFMRWQAHILQRLPYSIGRNYDPSGESIGYRY